MSREAHVQFWERVGVKLSRATRSAMVSFWSTRKSDTGLDESIPASRRHAELAVFDYIETFDNPTRRQRSLGQIACGLRNSTNTQSPIVRQEIG